MTHDFETGAKGPSSQGSPQHTTTGPGKSTLTEGLPPKDPSPIQPGERFGSATVVSRKDIVKDASPMTVAPGSGGKLGYHRYEVRLKNGEHISVDIPKTPKGSPYRVGTILDAAGPRFERHIDQARHMLFHIGNTNPEAFRGMSVIDAATNPFMPTKATELMGHQKAGGWYEPSTKAVSVTNESLAHATHGKMLLEHEGGHALGFRLAPGKGYTDGFFEALKADNKTTKYAAQFAANDYQQFIREAYAEAFQKYVENPEAYARTHPRQAAIIQRDLAQAARIDALHAPSSGGPKPPKPTGPDAPRDTPAAKPTGPDAPRAPAKPTVPVPAVSKTVASTVGTAAKTIGRKAVTFAANPVLGAADIAIEVMTPGRAGPSGWHRNDRRDWEELLAKADELVAKTPGLQRGEAVIRVAKEKGDPLDPHIVRDVLELDREERARARQDARRQRAREDALKVHDMNRYDRTPGGLPPKR